MGRIISKWDDFVARETYGIALPLTAEVRRKVGQAVLVVAAGDRDLSKQEMDHFLGLMRSMGAPDEMLEEWQKFDYKAASLKGILDDHTRPLARIILYDALRVARCDGMKGEEREEAVRMAKALGVDVTLVPALEGLLGIEDAARAMRLRLLSP
jgi:uncharacterized protein YifE (UPF0438 family)